MINGDDVSEGVALRQKEITDELALLAQEREALEAEMLQAFEKVRAQEIADRLKS